MGFSDTQPKLRWLPRPRVEVVVKAVSSWAANSHALMGPPGRAALGMMTLPASHPAWSHPTSQLGMHHAAPLQINPCTATDRVHQHISRLNTALHVSATPPAAGCSQPAPSMGLLCSSRYLQAQSDSHIRAPCSAALIPASHGQLLWTLFPPESIHEGQAPSIHHLTPAAQHQPP